MRISDWSSDVCSSDLRIAPVGEGTLTISFGTVTGAFPTPAGFSPNCKSVTITIGPDNNSLVGLQQAINASDSGLTASIIQDTGGARLVIKGETGAAQASPSMAALG